MLKICEAYIPKRGFLSAHVEMKLNEATKRERVLNIPCLLQSKHTKLEES